jgi:hypothetical protein
MIKLSVLDNEHFETTVTQNQAIEGVFRTETSVSDQQIKQTDSALDFLDC